MKSIDSIINRQLLIWESQQKALKEAKGETKKKPSLITISRQKGSRGSYFASRLAEKMDFQRLHREVIDSICKSSGYQKRIIESIDDKFRSELHLVVESLFSGQVVDHNDYIHSLAKVVLSMSELGGVILVGRGGNFIVGPKRGFHIRVVSSKKKRIQNLVDYKLVSKEEALEMVEESDAQRSLFIKKLFNSDIDNPSHYDMVVNSDYLDIEDMVKFVKEAAEAKFTKLANI